MSATQAVFATDCSAPTRTLAGGSNQPITVAPGERLLLTGGTFTGGVDSFPEGSFLCLAGSASLAPAYLNNAAGTLDIAPGGTASFPSISVATGFLLDNQGSATFAGLNINGAANIRNLPGGTMTVSSQFSPSAGGIVNNGSFTAAAGFNLNNQASFTNTGILAVTGSSTVNGRFENTGLARITGSLTVNGGATLDNQCALSTTEGLANQSTLAVNDGLVEVGGQFSNNGTWLQAATGTSRTGSLNNDGRVTGLGRYVVSAASQTQNQFVGSSPEEPIVVDDLTPPAPPQIFDVQSGTVQNVVAGTVRAEPPTTYPAPSCSGVVPRPSADVITTKTAPPTVVAGGQLQFTITVTNNGPSPADGVVVTDTLPTTLTGVTASAPGVVAGSTVTWSLGDLASGASVELTVTGTAPATGTLLNRVSSTADTPDPDPTNNDGTAEWSTTSTDVEPAPPPVNQQPVAEDVTVTGRADSLLLGRVAATDPDTNQTLRFSGPVSGPGSGRAVMAGGGAFLYRPDAGFAGHDSFTFRVCDNGGPSLCDTATVFAAISPIAADDEARTFEETPVLIPVVANDVVGGVLDSIDTDPANGTATIVGGKVEYTPVTGFLGTDTFTYSYCSPVANGAPILCTTAEVTVEVQPVNHPPLVAPQVVVTTTGTAVSGTVAATDPDADTVTFHLRLRPRSGTVAVRPDGSFTYTPRPGLSGVDRFTVVACDDGDPQLCSTAEVIVNVHPIAVDDRTSTTEGTAVTIAVLGNDSGAMNEPPQVTSPPTSGTVRVEEKRIVYEPDAGFIGTDSFGYRICSPGTVPLCARATVTVDVAPTPSPPEPIDPSQGPGGSGGGPGASTVVSSPTIGGLAATGGPAVAVVVGGLLLLLAGAALVLIGRGRSHR
ncbi:Ig-like domain-containing protein [Marmoricola sp. URHB0036]|uniref:Ig-like domain-containing protein n=1 Tax=Marmoricola sp. URHB0036 TaxID=1298863 RepID=UPI0018CB0A2F|nr:Ig-like domain-containing protein [Marmoricola sp. URHB0036]